MSRWIRSRALYTPPVKPWKSDTPKVSILTTWGSCLRWVRWLGLSRNKVAVSEGAAGSPPFYGERTMCQETALWSLFWEKKRKDKFDESIWEMECCSIFKDRKKRALKSKKSVLQTQRVPLFPFRTQKLSSAVVKILYGRLYGKIAQCWHKREGRECSALISKK